MNLQANGTLYELTVYGNGLTQFKLNEGDIIKIQKQNWALDGELIYIQHDNHEYEIKRYDKSKDSEINVFGVCRERRTVL